MDDADNDEPANKKKKSINRIAKPVVSSRFIGVDTTNVIKIGDFFREKEFCVIIGNDKYDKLMLEKNIAEYSGTIVQNPGKTTRISYLG